MAKGHEPELSCRAMIFLLAVSFLVILVLQFAVILKLGEVRRELAELRRLGGVMTDCMLAPAGEAE